MTWLAAGASLSVMQREGNKPRSSGLHSLGSRGSGSRLGDLLSNGRGRRSCVLGDADSRIFVRTISIRVSSLVANGATAIDVTGISTVGAVALTAIRR